MMTSWGGLYFGIHFWLLRFHVAFQEFQDYYQDSYMKEWANGVPEKKMAEDWKAYTVPQIQLCLDVQAQIGIGSTWIKPVKHN